MNCFILLAALMVGLLVLAILEKGKAWRARMSVTVLTIMAVVVLFILVGLWFSKDAEILAEGVSTVTQETNSGIVNQYWTSLTGDRQPITGLTNGLLVQPERYIVNMTEYQQRWLFIIYFPETRNKIHKWY